MGRVVEEFFSEELADEACCASNEDVHGFCSEERGLSTSNGAR